MRDFHHIHWKLALAESNVVSVESVTNTVKNKTKQKNHRILQLARTLVLGGNDLVPK